MSDRDEDRPKPSWRDIDRRRDQSRHLSGEALKRESPRAQRAASGYKATLDNFFEGGKAPAHVRPQLEKLDSGRSTSDLPLLTRAVRQAIGPREVEAAVNELLEHSRELPDDVDLLVQVLLHPDEEIVRDALARLDDLIARRMPKRKDLLLERLRRLETLAEEPQTIASAKALARRL